jgi:hypothetical protein
MPNGATGLPPPASWEASRVTTYKIIKTATRANRRRARGGNDINNKNNNTSMKAPKGKTFDPVPAGTHVARLYQIVHIGTTSFEYKGETKQSDKIRLTFELCNERKVFNEGDEPRPFSISREFGYSMSPKSHLRPFIEGMIGTKLHDEEAYNFETDSLLGEACLLSVVHVEKDGNTYANIQNASPLIKGMEAPLLFNKTSAIDVNTITDEELAGLPEFLQDKIKASVEYANRGDLKKGAEMSNDEEMRSGSPF